jgi:hypothetical protein
MRRWRRIHGLRPVRRYLNKDEQLVSAHQRRRASLCLGLVQTVDLPAVVSSFLTSECRSRRARLRTNQKHTTRSIRILWRFGGQRNPAQRTTSEYSFKSLHRRKLSCGRKSTESQWTGLNVAERRWFQAICVFFPLACFLTKRFRCFKQGVPSVEA